MNYLKGIIKCGVCNKNFNYKLNNGQEEWLCATKKNYTKSRCNSPTIKQQTLIDIIESHLSHQGKQFTLQKTKLFVKEIRIDNEKIKILYHDGTFSQLSDSEYLI